MLMVLPTFATIYGGREGRVTRLRLPPQLTVRI